MTKTLSRFLTASALLWAGFGAGSDALAQTAGITPKVGINTRTPEYTLDVNGKMRVAVVEATNQTATHLLAIDKTTKQVVKTAISELGVIKNLAKEVLHPADGVATYEFPISDIDPQTQVPLLLRANLRIDQGDQVHNQRLLSVADDPTKAADKRNTLMSAFVEYNVGGGPKSSTPFCGRVEGSNEQYRLKTFLGIGENNLPIPNSLMTTTKQVDLKLNATGTAYVFTGTFGRAVIAQNPGRLKWHLAILVMDKRWATQSQQVVRVKADNSLRNRDNTAYTPFYNKDPLRLSLRPKVEPIHQGESLLRGIGTPNAQIRVTQRQGGNTSNFNATVNPQGQWSLPVSDLTSETIFDVEQVEQVDGRDLPPSLSVRSIVRTHDPLANTDPLNPLVDGATQPARNKVGIGTRTPEKTLDVVGNWGLRDAPPYEYDDALLLGVGGGAASQNILRLRSGRRSVYSFTLAANNTKIDWIRNLSLNNLHSDYTLVATRAAFSRAELGSDGKYHSFDENTPERSAAYLSVSFFTPKDSRPFFDTKNLVVRNGYFGITIDADGSGHFSNSSIDISGGSQTSPYFIGAILFPNNKFASPIGLDYAGVIPMSRHLKYAWRVNYLSIRRSWMKQPIQSFVY